MSLLLNIAPTLKSFGEKAILIALLAFSVAINLFLARELFRVRGQVELLQANRKLTLGEKAPNLNARDKRGSEIVVEFANEPLPTIIYLTSVTCHWCDLNAENLRELTRQSVGKYQLITLSIEPAAEARPSVFPDSVTRELFEPSTESKLSFDLSSTPMTILVAQDGTVQKIWKGAYTTEREVEIEKMLEIQLPGIRDDFALGFSPDT